MPDDQSKLKEYQYSQPATIYHCPVTLLDNQRSAINVDKTPSTRPNHLYTDNNVILETEAYTMI